MGMFSAINTAATGLTAERLRLDVIADNIANVNTTRTADGGPYRRSSVIFTPRVKQPYWRTPFLPAALDNGVGKGVEVVEIRKDMDSDTRLVWDPDHADAHKSGPFKGYVEYPNVSVVSEMVDMISAQRAYEANVQVINANKAMFNQAVNIIA